MIQTCGGSRVKDMILASTPVGSNPRHCDSSPTGDKIYVANYLSNTVSVLNTTTDSVEATITVGTNPQSVAVSPDGSKVYVTNYSSGTVSVINTQNNTVSATITVGSNPNSVVFIPNGTKAYVANYSSSISVINVSNNSVSATLTSNGGAAVALVASPDNARVYVATNSSSGNHCYITVSTNTVTGFVGYISYASGISLSKNGSYLYIYSSGIGVLGTQSLNFIKSLNLGLGGVTNSVKPSPDGSQMYCTGTSNIGLIDVATNTAGRKIPLGSALYGIAISSSKSKLYVSNNSSSGILYSVSL